MPKRPGRKKRASSGKSSKKEALKRAHYDSMLPPEERAPIIGTTRFTSFVFGDTKLRHADAEAE